MSQLLIERSINMHIDDLRLLEEEGCYFILALAKLIREGIRINSHIAATAESAAAQIHTPLSDLTYASCKPRAPAPMICGVTPGTLARAASLSADRAAMKGPREVMGRPRGRTALAM